MNWNNTSGMLRFVFAYVIMLGIVLVSGVFAQVVEEPIVEEPIVEVPVVVPVISNYSIEQLRILKPVSSSSLQSANEFELDNYSRLNEIENRIRSIEMTMDKLLYGKSYYEK